MSLDPIDPDTALELYLADRESEVSQATLYSHNSRLGHFVRWCGEQNLTNLNELTGRQLHQYRLWRRRDGDLAPASEKTQMDTLRVFVRWLESIDAVTPDLHTKVRSPSLDPADDVRDVMVESAQAEKILGYLETYQYASREHVVLTLLWHTMMRVGAVHALDVADYDPQEQSLEVVHRPETETPIKNAERGERLVALSGETCILLDDWLETQRPDVVDDTGRAPLITTSQGRAHQSTLRLDCYRFTRPCIYNRECPHDKDSAECTWLDYGKAAECPSSVSPHAFRRGGITHALTNEMPARLVGERANVSEDVLDQHYDQRDSREKMEVRRKYLEMF